MEETKERQKTKREVNCVRKLPFGVCAKQYCKNNCFAKECKFYKR